MIIQSTFRGAGGLARHLLKTGLNSNEQVIVRTDLSLGVFGDVLEDLSNFVAISTATGKTNSLLHVSISPSEPLTPQQERDMLQQLRSAYEIPVDHSMLVVMHVKISEGRICPHYHIVMPTRLETGRVIRDSYAKVKNERIARTLEIDFGHEHVVGAHNHAVHHFLQKSRPDIAHLVAANSKPKRYPAMTLNEKQQAERYRVNPKETDAVLLNLYMKSSGNMNIFAHLLDDNGFTIGRGEKAIMVIQENTGYAASLSRVIARAAKSANVDLKVNNEQFDAAFSHARPLRISRNLGFRRAHSVAESSLVREFAKAIFEAGADGDASFVIREKARLKAELFTTAERYKRAATIAATRDAIFDLLRHRNACRRRRVDRAFKVAGMVRRKYYVRRAFKLAAGITLLTGAGLSIALGVGVVAAGAAMMHRETAYGTAKRLALKSAKDRTRDMVVARLAANEITKPSGVLDEKAPKVVHRNDIPKKPDGNNANLGQAERSTLPQSFSFDHIDKADRALVGLFVQLITKNQQPALASAISQALGVTLNANIKSFLSIASPKAKAVMSGWFKENPHMLRSAMAALHKRGEHGVATKVRIHVQKQINSGIG